MYQGYNAFVSRSLGPNPAWLLSFKVASTCHILQGPALGSAGDEVCDLISPIDVPATAAHLLIQNEFMVSAPFPEDSCLHHQNHCYNGPLGAINW